MIELIPWSRQIQYGRSSEYQSYLWIDKELFDEIGMEGVQASLEMYLAEQGETVTEQGEYK